MPITPTKVLGASDLKPW